MYQYLIYYTHTHAHTHNALYVHHHLNLESNLLPMYYLIYYTRMLACEALYTSRLGPHTLVA